MKTVILIIVLGFTPIVFAQSSANWNNNPQNWKNSPQNWDNSSQNWKNSPQNWDNSPQNYSNKNGVYNNQGVMEAYKVPSPAGTNFFNTNGDRVGYTER